MADQKPICALLDSNVWLSENQLRSMVGEGLLFALTQRSGVIGLPEVVELEVTRMLSLKSDDMREETRKAVGFLDRIAAKETALALPTQGEIERGILRQWKRLGGSLERVPFTLDQARSALQRVLAHQPPSGKNNEQFRDCCIWEAVLSLAKDFEVHLVTRDKAFYGPNGNQQGFAPALAAESLPIGVHLHETIGAFLGATGTDILDKDREALKSKIRDALLERSKLTDRVLRDFSGGFLSVTKLHGFATPSRSTLAVAFEARYLDPVPVPNDQLRRGLTGLILGTCAFDMTTQTVSELKPFASGYGSSAVSDLTGDYWERRRRVLEGHFGSIEEHTSDDWL